MTMDAPIQTLILDEVEARLASIKTANGYTRTVTKPKRATMMPFQDTDLPGVNFWPGEDRITGRGAGFVLREMALFVECYDLTRDRPFPDVAFEIARDITIALHRTLAAPAVTDNPEQSFGGLITSLQLTSTTPQIGTGQAPWCGALMTYSVAYKCLNDGFTPA